MGKGSKFVSAENQVWRKGGGGSKNQRFSEWPETVWFWTLKFEEIFEIRKILKVATSKQHTSTEAT